MHGRRRLVLAAAVVLLTGLAAAVAFADTPPHAQHVPRWLLPNAVAFFDRSHGVLGTGYRYSGHNGGAIEQTSDGGRARHVVERTARPVVGLVPFGSFLYARLDDGETLQSRDGGRTWRPTTNPIWPPSSSVCPIGLYAGSNGGDQSWSVCSTQGGAGNEGKAVYRNLGRGWVRVACTNFSTSRLPCGKRSYGGISSLGYPVGIAGAARGGFGIIWESRGTIWVTRDGGRHWTGKMSLAVFDADSGSWASVLPRGGGGFAILTRSVQTRLVETTNVGRTWRVVGRWTTNFG